MTTTVQDRLALGAVLTLVVVAAFVPFIGAPVAGIVYIVGRQRHDDAFVAIGVGGFCLTLLILMLLYGI
jgi:hypothetical protein